mgnify:CR=1 FL=1
MSVMKKVSEEMKSTLNTKGMIREFRNKFGISIVDFDLSDITPSNPDDALYAVKEWRAQQVAKEKVAEAEGKKQAEITVSEGIAKGIALRTEVMETPEGVLAARLRTTEAMVNEKTIFFLSGGQVAPEDIAPQAYLADRLQAQRTTDKKEDKEKKEEKEEKK